MAIYTSLGAPVQLIEAERRVRWYAVFKNGDRKTYDQEAPPTFSPIRRPVKLEEFDIWWIKAVTTGTYPDGSGKIGEHLDWRTENEFIADDGLKEILNECEAIECDGTPILWGSGPYKGKPLTADPTFKDYLAKRFA